MFKITEETRNLAIEAMRQIMEQAESSGEDTAEETLGKCFDAAVDIVKKQFGM